MTLAEFVGWKGAPNVEGQMSEDQRVVEVKHCGTVESRKKC